MLNEQFSSGIFTQEDINTILDFGLSPYPEMSEIKVNKNGVRILLRLKDLISKKACGLWVRQYLSHTAELKCCFEEISPILLAMLEKRPLSAKYRVIVCASTEKYLIIKL